VIWDWNIVENRVWWSEGIRTLFGYQKDEVRVETSWWRERLHPEDRERIAAAVNAFIEGDATFWSDEYRYCRADGSYALVIDRAFIVRDDEGRAVRMIGSMMDITERRRAEEKINYLAYYDALTGLPNRTLFEDRLPQALALAQRNEQVVAVMLLDLDRFKSINDTLGHSVGDSLLRLVGERLSSCVRRSDTVARFAGDGFALVLTQIGRREDAAGVARQAEKKALDVVHKILEALQEPFSFEGHEFYVTASIGIGLYPKHGEDPQTLLKNVGAALHSVKEQGGNNYQLYAASMNAKAVERLTLESALRRALDREEFVLHYQPQIEINSSRIIGVEALIRWKSPEFGMVSPAEFIPVAENNGLIVPIGEWSLQTACVANKSWQVEGLPRIRMSINLSPRQFEQPNLIETVTRVLHETGLDPSYLEFELTESSIMKNAERAIVTLGKLKAMNIQIAIDDFGSGYSSLSYLKRFPIDRLKIDQSFVREATKNPTDAAIIMAIITLAQNLRLKVIAEGVETEEQSRFLHLLRCDELQGFLFSKPLPEEQLKQLLVSRADPAVDSTHVIASQTSQPGLAVQS
jgi:diguanylate cyclase (GGDEF)-like protein/PAS domain S-box-containing protein